MHSSSTDQNLTVQEKKNLPQIAILVLNWNSYTHTHTCLQSLKRCTQELFQVIVIDNHSSDGSVDVLEAENPEVIFLRNKENLGFTGGNNVGIEYALTKGYEFIMLLNNDTEVQPNFLEPLLKVLDEHPEAGAVQPKMMYNHDRNLIWNAGGMFKKWLCLPVSLGAEKKDHPRYDIPKRVDWITGCCILTRSEIVKRVGGQDESFFYGYDDVDWSFRLKEGDKNTLHYEPASVIFHDAGVAGRNEQGNKEGFLKPFVHYFYVRNNIFILRRYASWVFLPTIVLFHVGKFSGYLVYFLLRRRFRKFSATIAGIKDGLSLNMQGPIDHLGAIKKFSLR